MRVKLLCGEEAATVLLVDLARLSEYGRALDTLRPACLRGRHRRTARPVDLLDNATHARHEISISGCTTGSYRAKRRAKRTCTPRPRISAIEVIRAARKQRLEASSDTPTTTPVCPTSSSRTPVTHRASDRADDPSRHRAVRPTATTPGSIQKHKPVGAPDARPRQTAHRPNGVEQTTAARASSPAPTTKCPNQLGRPITDRIERHRAINPQRCDASFTTRRRRRLASQLHTFSPQPYRDGQALPHASSRTTGDRKASSCTPEGFEQTRRTPATTPVRYPAGHPVTHHVKRQTVRTPGPDTEPSARPPQLQGASRSTSHPRPERTAASNRPPNRRRRANDRRTRIESPRPKPRLLRSVRISSSARPRTASRRHAQPTQRMKQTGDQPVRVE